jgi:hypothetical protein
LSGGLEHLKIETRLIDERFPPECDGWVCDLEDDVPHQYLSWYVKLHPWRGVVHQTWRECWRSSTWTVEVIWGDDWQWEGWRWWDLDGQRQTTISEMTNLSPDRGLQGVITGYDDDGLIVGNWRLKQWLGV